MLCSASVGLQDFNILGTPELPIPELRQYLQDIKCSMPYPFQNVILHMHGESLVAQVAGAEAGADAVSYGVAEHGVEELPRGQHWARARRVRRGRQSEQVSDVELEERLLLNNWVDRHLVPALVFRHSPHRLKDIINSNQKE